jgi:hypothetical protein
MSPTKILTAFTWEYSNPREIFPIETISLTSISAVANYTLGSGLIGAVCLMDGVVHLNVPSQGRGRCVLMCVPGSTPDSTSARILSLQHATLTYDVALAAHELFRCRLGKLSKFPRAASVDAIFSIRLEQETTREVHDSSSDEDYVGEDDQEADEDNEEDENLSNENDYNDEYD